MGARVSARGREIQELIEAAISLDIRQTKDSAGTFIWTMDFDPAAAKAFRANDGVRGDPSEVPIEQLRALAVECGVVLRDETALLVAMRNACGFQKMGSAVRARLEEALGRPEA